MDREEARELLLGYSRFINEETDLWEALDLAIEALQESAEKYTNATTNLYNSRLAKDLMGISEEAEKLQLFGETSITSKTETVDTSTNTPTKTPTNDCISRQDAIEALMAHFIPQTYTGEQVEQAEKLAQKIMNEVPPVNQKQITGKLESAENATSEGEESTISQPKSKLDCISRQQAIEALCEECIHGGYDTCSVDCTEVAVLHNLPPVTPTERVTETMIVDGMEMEIDPVSYEVGYSHGQVASTERTGEWDNNFKCSNCGRILEDIHVIDARNNEQFNFCPVCGADMRGDTE